MSVVQYILLLIVASHAGHVVSLQLATGRMSITGVMDTVSLHNGQDADELTSATDLQMLDLQRLVASSWMDSDSLGDEHWIHADNTNVSWLALWLALQPSIGISDDNDGHIAVRRRLGLRLMSMHHKKNTASDMATEVADYAQAYRSEFSQRSAVFFSHISKACGTTLCMCGWDSGCKAWGARDEEDNCHPRGVYPPNPWDMPAWGGIVLRKPEWNKCSALSDYNREHEFTLEGNENYLIEEGLCQEFWNVIVMRDPLDRLMSHFAYLNSLDPVRDRWAQIKVGQFWKADVLEPEWIFQNAPVISNNFYIRNLIGPQGYALPFGAVTDEHFEVAKRQLESFDLIFIKSKGLVTQIQSLLGWSCRSPNTNMGQTEDYQNSLQQRWSDEDWNTLRDANALDIALFKYARDLSKVDRQVLEHPVFKAIVDGECSNSGTCGLLCK